MSSHTKRSVFAWLSAAAAAALAGSAASAAVQTAVIDGVTVTDYGRVGPTSADFLQPGFSSGTAQIQIGQVTGPGNPPAFPNPGWDPYGLGDTTHHWWNIYGGTVWVNATSDRLTLNWGSPNNDSSSATNMVWFYSGPNGTGSLIGEVTAYDLYSNFTGITNTTDPGYLTTFLTPTAFGSVVFTTSAPNFEFAVIPEASTWAMMLLGFAGLGLAVFGRGRQDRIASPIA